jgi:hypothetical protein
MTDIGVALRIEGVSIQFVNSGDTMLTHWRGRLGWLGFGHAEDSEITGRPLCDRDFVRRLGALLGRDLLPKKSGPKGPRRKANT